MGNGLSIGIRDYPGAGYRIEHAVGVGAGVNGQHARRGLGGAGIYPSDSSVGVGAAQDGRVDHARQLNVVGIGGSAGYQPGVLPTSDTGTKKPGRHILTSHRIGGGQGRFDNVVIAGAPADISFQSIPYFLGGRVWVLI